MTDVEAEAPLRRPRDLHQRDPRLPNVRTPSPRVLQWLVVLVLVAGVASLVVKGADQPADPTFRTGRQQLAGFGEIAYRVNRSPDALRCAVLAQSAAQHAQGLGNLRDLGGHDGMLFVFPADTTQPLTAREAPFPVSTAWFDAGGRYLGETDAERCTVDCPDLKSPSPYRYALQVPKGGLGDLGVGTGAVLSVGGPCA